MPYQLKWEENGVYCQFSGDVTDQDIIQCNMDIYGDPRFDDLRYELLDFLQMVRLSFSEESVEVIASCDTIASKTNPYIFCAVVTNERQLALLSDFYNQETNEMPWQSEAFESVEDARTWINKSHLCHMKKNP